MNKELKWESVHQDSSYVMTRLPIFGGWVIMTVGLGQISTTFVPDPTHSWDLTKDHSVKEDANWKNLWPEGTPLNP